MVFFVFWNLLTGSINCFYRSNVIEDLQTKLRIAHDKEKKLEKERDDLQKTNSQLIKDLASVPDLRINAQQASLKQQQEAIDTNRLGGGDNPGHAIAHQRNKSSDREGDQAALCATEIARVAEQRDKLAEELRQCYDNNMPNEKQSQSTNLKDNNKNNVNGKKGNKSINNNENNKIKKNKSDKNNNNKNKNKR